jgi:TetR/AcrR family transcriptional regulator, fatty acid metabolism regulator protein
MTGNRKYFVASMLDERSYPPGKLFLIDALKYLLEKKDFNSITTAEIAKKANKGEYLIYWHFKDKRGLLDQILENYLQEHIELINSELKKLKSPLDKLKKIMQMSFEVWNKNKIYSKIILFEARKFPDYFKSKIYITVQYYINLINNNIQEWNANGEIRNDLPPNFLRNIFLGGMLQYALSAVIFNKRISPKDSTDNLFEILLNGIVTNSHEKDKLEKGQRLPTTISIAINKSLYIEKKNEPKGKREKCPSGKIKLADAMRQLLRNKDFYSITIKEISEIAKTNEALIYRYFGSKRGLLHHVLSDYLEKRNEVIVKDLKSANGALDKLIIFVQDTFKFYFSHIIFTKILLIEVRNFSEYFKSDTFKLALVYVQLFSDIITEGMLNGEIRNDVSSEAITNLITGTIDHIMLHSMIYNLDTQPNVFSENLIKVLLNGITLQKEFYNLEDLKIEINKHKWGN